MLEVTRDDGSKVVLFESVVINEYLDEVFPKPPLMPVDPYMRAWARIWIDYADNTFIQSTYKLMIAKTQDQQDEPRVLCVDNMRFIENEAMTRFDGPYWLGGEVSLVDISFYPFFERLPAMAALRGLEIPTDCPRLQDWTRAMADLDSVKATANDGEFYVERYRTFLDELTPDS